jgi:hypothetical protein
MTKSQTTSWLSEFLPSKFPTARILIFAHNADWFVTAPYTTTAESGKTLLQDLSNWRNEDKVASRLCLLHLLLTVSKHKRPIIFIGHSFGGIIVKEVRFFSLNLKRANC